MIRRAVPITNNNIISYKNVYKTSSTPIFNKVQRSQAISLQIAIKPDTTKFLSIKTLSLLPVYVSLVIVNHYPHRARYNKTLN